MEQERPRVVLRGPGDGDPLVLTMGPHRAHITRKAARTETGGHWAVGEAWQTPASITLLTRMTRRRRSTSSKGVTPSTPTLTRGGRRSGHLRLHSARSCPRLSDWTARRQAHLPLALDGRGRVLQRQNGWWLRASERRRLAVESSGRSPGRRTGHRGRSARRRPTGDRLPGWRLRRPMSGCRTCPDQDTAVGDGGAEPPCGAVPVINRIISCWSPTDGTPHSGT